MNFYVLINCQCIFEILQTARMEKAKQNKKKTITSNKKQPIDKEIKAAEIAEEIKGIKKAIADDQIIDVNGRIILFNKGKLYRTREFKPFIPAFMCFDIPQEVNYKLVPHTQELDMHNIISKSQSNDIMQPSKNEFSTICSMIKINLAWKSALKRNPNIKLFVIKGDEKLKPQFELMCGFVDEDVEYVITSDHVKELVDNDKVFIVVINYNDKDDNDIKEYIDKLSNVNQNFFVMNNNMSYVNDVNFILPMCFVAFLQLLSCTVLSSVKCSTYNILCKYRVNADILDKYLTTEKIKLNLKKMLMYAKATTLKQYQYLVLKKYRVQMYDDPEVRYDLEFTIDESEEEKTEEDKTEEEKTKKDKTEETATTEEDKTKETIENQMDVKYFHKIATELMFTMTFSQYNKALELLSLPLLFERRGDPKDQARNYVEDLMKYVIANFN